MTPLVAVVGSANLDIVLMLDRRPTVGETVLGSDCAEFAGGKGVNQATAAAKIVPTTLIATIGDDAEGRIIATALTSAGVDTDHLQRNWERTGRAYITLTPDGENDIVVLPFANWELDTNLVVVALDKLQPDVVLTQLEVPPTVTDAVATWCSQQATRLILNASPVRPLPQLALDIADPLIVNEGEARAILNTTTGAPADLARALARTSRSVVLTAGGDGAFISHGTNSEHIRGEHVTVVDTTGAGDAFAGTLAGHLAQRTDLSAGVHEANIIAATVVQHTRSERAQ